MLGYTLRLFAVTLAMVAVLPGQQIWQQRVWQEQMIEANRLTRAGEYREAIAAFEQAIRIASQPGAPPEYLPYALNGQGLAYGELAQLDRADALYRRALALIEQSRGRTNAAYASVLANLAGSLTARGQLAKAEKLLRESIGLHLAAVPPDPVNLALARNALGKILMERSALEEAEAVLEDAMRALEGIPQAKVQLGMAVNNWGALLSHRGRYAEAAVALERSLALIEPDLGPRNPWLVHTLTNLGTAYTLNGDYERARVHLERARSIAEERLAPENPIYGVVLNRYAALLRKTGQKSGAKKLEAKARSILEGSARRNGSATSVDISALRPR
jgi:tetratricopeptide (TPR) repeat protein